VLKFDEKDHIYTWNGTRVPSPTGVLSDQGVIDYSQIPEPIRTEALARGNRVHKAIMIHCTSIYGVNMDELFPSDVPFVKAYLKFEDDTGYRPFKRYVERPGYNKEHGYAGTPDSGGSFPGKRRAVIDFKSGSSEKWVRMQTAAYQNLDYMRKMFEGAERYALTLKADGRYDLSSPFMSPQDFIDFVLNLEACKSKSRY